MLASDTLTLMYPKHNSFSMHGCEMFLIYKGYSVYFKSVSDVRVSE